MANGKKLQELSTLMNKIFEIIEAQKLFNIPNEKLDILIHPNSLVHAIVEYKNGFKKFLYLIFNDYSSFKCNF